LGFACGALLRPGKGEPSARISRDIRSSDGALGRAFSAGYRRGWPTQGVALGWEKGAPSALTGWEKKLGLRNFKSGGFASLRGRTPRRWRADLRPGVWGEIDLGLHAGRCLGQARGSLRRRSRAFRISDGASGRAFSAGYRRGRPTQGVALGWEKGAPSALTGWEKKLRRRNFKSGGFAALRGRTPRRWRAAPSAREQIHGKKRGTSSP
jgi:hypothetical protein